MAANGRRGRPEPARELIGCRTARCRATGLIGSAGDWACGAGRGLRLTWPGLQQVMQHLDVALEVHRVGEAGARAARAGPGGGLARRQQHRTETDGQVLRGHAIVGVEGGHEAQVVQQKRQRGLRREARTRAGGGQHRTPWLRERRSRWLRLGKRAQGDSSGRCSARTRTSHYGPFWLEERQVARRYYHALERQSLDSNPSLCRPSRADFSYILQRFTI